MSATTRSAAILAATLTLAGCQEYLARQDLIEPYSGDAIARNSALQVSEPWPRYAYDTNIPTSGQRQGNALTNYKTHGEKEATQPLQPVQLVVPSQ